MLAEKEMREEDLERVPIILKNPPYFKPFEIFTSILPLPAYTSYDPTPFIGIFFPVFFGMILGDAGYGLLLGGCSPWPHEESSASAGWSATARRSCWSPRSIRSSSASCSGSSSGIFPSGSFT